MRKIVSLLLCPAFSLFAFIPVAYAQQKPVGIFEDHADVGNPIKQGSVTYNAQTQEYTMEGAGTNMWKSIDQFHFLWKKIKGDFIITASVKFIGKGVPVTGRSVLSPGINSLPVPAMPMPVYTAVSLYLLHCNTALWMMTQPGR
ncbi:MAG: hypothetical protein WDO16_02975 [Bacteroidota bacterium]